MRGFANWSSFSRFLAGQDCPQGQAFPLGHGRAVCHRPAPCRPQAPSRFAQRCLSARVSGFPRPADLLVPRPGSPGSLTNECCRLGLDPTHLPLPGCRRFERMLCLREHTVETRPVWAVPPHGVSDRGRHQQQLPGVKARLKVTKRVACAVRSGQVHAVRRLRWRKGFPRVTPPQGQAAGGRTSTC